MSDEAAAAPTPGSSPGPTRRRARADLADSATRDALLDGARACVRERGIAGATSRLITSTAGVNLAAITYYFGSKDELVAEALFGDLERRLDPVLELLESDAPAATRLLDAVRDLINEFERTAEDVPLYLEALVLSTGTGPLAGRGRALMAHLRTRLAGVVAQLIAAGSVSSWVDPEAMASLLIATANGIALQSRLEPDNDILVTAMTAHLARLLVTAADPTGRPDLAAGTPALGMVRQEPKRQRSSPDVPALPPLPPGPGPLP